MDDNMLMNEIEKYKEIKVYSFDIFDTLIKRTVKKPNDVFKLIQIKYNKENLGKEKRFFEKRITAEQVSRSKCKHEVTLEMIYSDIDLDEEEKDLFMNLEIEMEKENCVPNQEAVDCLISLFHKGEKIIITSDMYLPTEVLSQMLEKCGVKPEYYERLYVSGDIGVTKYSGELFAHIVSELNIEAKHILHIGDNELNDVKNARSYGLSACHVKNHVKKISYWDNKNIARNIKMNHLISFLENSNVNKKSDFEQIGYGLLGPILYSYCCWLHEKMLDLRIDKLLFLSREGYLPYLVYNELFPEDKDNVRYISINRNTLLYPILYISPSVHVLLNNLPMIFPDYCYRDILLCLSPERDDKYIDNILSDYKITDPEKRYSLQELESDRRFHEICNQILTENREKYRQQYLMLLEYLSLNDVSGKIALANNSMSASAQRKLSAIIEYAKLDIELWNVHFIRNRSIDKSLFKGIVWFGKTCSEFDKKVYFTNCLLFEHLQFEDKGTALYYYREDNELKVMRESHSAEKYNDGYKEEVRKGVLGFIREYRKVFPAELESSECLKAWIAFIKYPEKNHVEAISRLCDYDNGEVSKFVNVKHGIASVEKSKWKQGSYTFNDSFDQLKKHNRKLFFRACLKRRRWS